MQVIHQSMRIDVSYNIYVLNNPQKYPKKMEKSHHCLKVTFLSRTSRNWCTEPLHTIIIKINTNTRLYPFYLMKILTLQPLTRSIDDGGVLKRDRDALHWNFSFEQR
jgi:hypothetical protein